MLQQVQPIYLIFQKPDGSGETVDLFDYEVFDGLEDNSERVKVFIQLVVTAASVRQRLGEKWAEETIRNLDFLVASARFNNTIEKLSTTMKNK